MITSSMETWQQLAERGLQVSSMQNSRVKELVALQQKSQQRRRKGLFVVEGRRELMHCMEGGMELDTVFLCPELLDAAADGVPGGLPGGADVVSVTPQVYAKIAYRGTTEGIMATVRTPELSLEQLTLPDNPLIVVLESVEKPGNLGAVLRSADAAGVDAVIVCDPLTDLFNPNLIRSSVGGAFTVPTVATTSEQCISYLQERGISILTAQLQDSHPYYHTDMRRPTAIVMGTEATGLTPQWRKAATAHIRIPMLGRIDSLNVSVSAAILMFEAVRQRQAGE